MIIDSIELSNFRNFEKKTFEFPSQFTIVIGENGKGKSTILQGMRLAAATFFLGIDEAERIHIQKEDVRRVDLGNRFVPQKNCSFSAKGQLGSTSLSWKRTLSKPGGRTDYKDASELIALAKTLNDRVNEKGEEEVALPVFCFFSTARLWVESKQTYKLKKKGSRLRDGYTRSLDERSDKTSAMEWIKSSFWKKLKGNPESALLDGVLEAIATCIPNWRPIDWDEDSDDLGGIYTRQDGKQTFIPLFFLSDGLRIMAAMVAEIAYRCVVLNPFFGKDAVKLSQGLVLIDEIDMHLHPKWQQSVVSDLKKAFPNLQFVATTHSPFIVQSLKSDELINLDRITDIDPIKLSVGEVSTAIMGLPDIHSLESQKTYKKATEYLKILEKPTKELREEDLVQIETSISDPGVRAFLQLQKLKKEFHK
jgi:predicted ATP-binding protein involved in virulence